MTSESENKLLARQFLEEVANTGAVDRLPEFLASDCTIRHTNMQGLAWFREHLLTFHHCYPDLHVTVDGQAAEEDTVVTWWTMRGTHLGAFGGVPATGKPITLRGVNVQRIRNGRIVEHWGGSSSLEALLEIGVVRWAGSVGVASMVAQGAAPKGDPGTRADGSEVAEGLATVS